MILIIGGFAQGKREYAKEKYHTAEEKMINLNKWVQELPDDVDGTKLLRATVEKEPDTVVVTTMTGCGIVPLDQSERFFRRRLGRMQCEAAKLADEVIRVECGIGQKIK